MGSTQGFREPPHVWLWARASWAPQAIVAATTKRMNIGTVISQKNAAIATKHNNSSDQAGGFTMDVAVLHQ
jgi:hypothetical protein